jgi:hypothetical protein
MLVTEENEDAIVLKYNISDIKETIFELYNQYIIQTESLSDHIKYPEIKNSLILQLKTEQEHMMSFIQNETLSDSCIFVFITGTSTEIKELYDFSLGNVQRYIELTVPDKGHGLNNVRVAYVLALVYGQELSRSVIFPENMQAAAWLLEDILGIEKIDQPYTWLIDDIWDIKSISTISSNKMNGVIDKELPRWIRYMPRINSQFSTTIFGSEYRPFFRWDESTVIEVYQNFPGIFAVMPYFFCDFRSMEFKTKRLVANSALKIAEKLLKNNVYPILDLLHGQYGKKIIAIHFRYGGIYSGLSDSSDSFLDKLVDDCKLLLSNEEAVIFAATSNATLLTNAFAKAGYKVYVKEDIIGGWDNPLIIDPRLLSFKSTSIDLEVSARSDIFIGTVQSSFSTTVASMRFQDAKFSNNTFRYTKLCGFTKGEVCANQGALPYEFGEFCPVKSPCFYIC